jgi:hypothetical protein
VGAVGLALAACRWDRRARFPLAGLYVLGLAAAGLLLHGLGRPPAWLAWNGTLVLGAYVALTSLFQWAAIRRQDLGRRLRLPARPPQGWFLPAQAAAACAVVGLSVWVCLDFAHLDERLTGPLAVLLLVGAGVLLAGVAPGG